jgi:hypothetical protein
MNQTESGISRITAVLIICAMLLFTHLVQAQSVASAPEFDHSKTGFILRDVHNTLKCEQCHVEGIFKNTPKVCSGCHTLGTRVASKPKPINHVPTTSECDTCHISAANFLVKSYQHIGITGACSSCHNGFSLGVLSKPANHFPTTQPCENCHKNTATFLSWTMDHTGVSGGCASCHQGQFPNVVSLPLTGHVAITPGQDCSSCHVGFTTFLGAVFDHSGIGAARCDSCHGGQMSGVVKLPPVTQHITIPAGNDCNVCHISTTSFLGALYSHAGVTSGSCDTCHTGAYPGVLTKPGNHIPTSSAKCDVCHTAINTVGYTSFKNSQYHAAVTATAGSCTGCHNGSYNLLSGNGMFAQSVASASGGHIPVASSSCDLCHTESNTSLYNNFQGASYHAGQSTTPGTCTTCHSGAIKTQSVTLVPPYGKTDALSLMGSAHVTTTAECDTCHTQALTRDYTTFTGSLFDHTAVTPAVAGRCSACHGNITPVIAKQKSSSHLLTTAECDTCHTQALTKNYTTFLGVGYHATNVVAAGSCGKATCHDGSGTAGAVGKPGTHLTTAAVCDSCHTSSTTASFTTWKNAKYHINVTVVAGSCGNAGCHDGSANGIAMGAVGKSSSHVVTAAACDTCHITTSNYTNWLGATYTHTAAQSGICQTCHNDVAAHGQGTHIPAPGTCDTAGCHTTALTNYVSGAVYPAAWLGATFAPHPASVVAGTCRTCHTGTYAGVSTQSFNPGPAGLSGLNGQPHTVTAAQCDSSGCHVLSASQIYGSTPSWGGAGYDHSLATTGSCINAGCHGAGGAGKGISTNHMSVTVSCDSGGCHKVYSAATPTFAGGVWVHSVTAGLRCDSCHDGNHLSFGLFGATGITGVPSATTPHIPIGSGNMSGANDCNFCHTSMPPNVAASSKTDSWSIAIVGVMQHNGDPGKGAPDYCVNCHLSSSKYYAPGIKRVSHNGAGTSKDCSTDGCHKPGLDTTKQKAKGVSWSSWD